MPPKRTPRPRPQSSRSISGSGSLSFAGSLPDRGGSGIVAQDSRSSGFAARIKPLTVILDTPTNAYAFAEVDDSDPEFSDLPGGRFGDGAQLAAFERFGNLSVPTDGTAVVWLEPLLGRAGYGFTYSSSAAATEVNQSITTYAITADDTWENVTGCTITLPGAGSYILTATVTARAEITVGDDPSATGFVHARLYSATRGQSVSDSDVLVVATTSTGYATVSWRVEYVGAANEVIQLQAARASGVTWDEARLYGSQNLVSAFAGGRITLGYVKLA